MEITPGTPTGRFAAIRLQTVSALLLASVCCAASEPADSVKNLREVEVSGNARRNMRVMPDGSITLGSSAIGLRPRAFGEADPLKALGSAAGVTSISDYSSGMSIDGMNYSQNLYCINGAPVQFPYHFGGIFSTFNAVRYPAVTLNKSVHAPGSADCLGGIVNFSTADALPDRPTGNVNVGMLASTLSVEIPAGRRVSIAAAGRVSYIDALYHRLLSSSHTDVRYDLNDIDAEIKYTPRRGCLLKLFAHYNADRLRYLDDNFSMDTRLRWHNTLAGAQWTSGNLSANAWFSGMSNTLTMSMGTISLLIPSSINQGGGVASWNNDLSERVGIVVGASAVYTSAEPLQVAVNGISRPDGEPTATTATGRSFTSKVHASATVGLWHGASLDVGVDLNAYFGPDGYRTVHPAPRLTLRTRLRQTDFILHFGRYFQYISQTGLSEIGMSTNFKLTSTRRLPPQQALNCVVGASRYFPVLNLRLSADAYYKRILNQPEYFGGVLDLLDTNYSAENFINSCNGYNTGVNITANRDFSDLTASVAYSFGIARRRLPDAGKWFTASSDIRHSLSVNAAYTFDKGRYNINASFSLASGRPVTPVTAVYFIGQRLMVEYGRPNSSRLPLYHRLDLGASRKFTTGRLRHTVSLSIINAYGRRNVEISNFTFNTTTGTIGRRDISSLYRFMPSLAYTLDF